eukprot:gnl/TRDRNA2_/TRDRNA2_94148_c0_seq1.p1 gnl/TRDRNA2_/TRDRNA2_94148_c0~~gnl/TRDRNA2_/TRDRNA2_94148_c0_seq1.p1  ORF type:complete len:112 (-),score=30.93 gnl/TRDRNA2_/TRDRNA2_94148_c0_seq1:83-418(-)
MTMFAGLYEVGRPKRLEGDAAVKEEEMYSNFAAFADERLELRPSARCHTNEILTLFRIARGDEQIEEQDLERYLRRWGAGRFRRKKQGFLQGVAIKKAYQRTTMSDLKKIF